MKPNSCHFAIVAGALACSPVVQAASWPEFPGPPRAQVEWVAQEAVVNGLPARIERFDSELSVDEVLDFYRARWARAIVGKPRETASGHWRALSTLEGGFQLVVQVKPRDRQGSTGLLSVMNFGEAQRDFLPRNWPSWRDAQVTQVTTSLDGPKRGQLVSMVSTEGLDTNVRRWRQEWQRRGFELTHEMKPAPVEGTRSWVGIFDRGPQSAEVAVSHRDADRQTFVTVNLHGPVDGVSP